MIKWIKSLFKGYKNFEEIMQTFSDMVYELKLLGEFMDERAGDLRVEIEQLVQQEQEALYEADRAAKVADKLRNLISY